MPVLYLSPQQVMGSRCTTGVPHDWVGYKSPDQREGETSVKSVVPSDGVGYKSPDQMAVGRALDWSLDLDRDWFWGVVGFGVSSLFVYITIYLTGHHIV